MKLSMITVRAIEDGSICVEDLTPNQQLQYKQYLMDKKIVDNNVHQQIVDRLNVVGEFDVMEIDNILEKYADDNEEFIGMYKLLDFKWINGQIVVK